MGFVRSISNPLETLNQALSSKFKISVTYLQLIYRGPADVFEKISGSFEKSAFALPKSDCTYYYISAGSPIPCLSIHSLVDCYC